MVLGPQWSRPVFHPVVSENVHDFGKQNPHAKTDS